MTGLAAFQTYRRMKAKPRDGKRSSFEADIEQSLMFKGVNPSYEAVELKYFQNYIPDFLLPNGIFIEAKGFFTPEDRTKMIAVKLANPEADIRFVFMANNKIHKASKMRYGDWCNKHGFLWAVKEVPDSWLHENHEPSADKI